MINYKEKIQRLFRSKHVFGSDPLVELLSSQVTQLDRLLLQRRSILVGSLGDLGCLVVADVRVEGRHQHK